MRTILESLISTFTSTRQFKTIQEINPELYNWILQITLQYNPKNIIEMVYIIIYGAPPVLCKNNIQQIPHDFISFTSGYKKFCSNTCVCRQQARTNKLPTKSDDQTLLILKKRTETNLEKFGVEYPMQLQEIRDKVKSTMLEKYGVENPSQSQEIRDKVKSTMLEKFGVVSNLQLPDVVNVARDSILKKYGVLYPFQSELIRNTANKAVYNKYGVDNVFSLTAVQQKSKQTMLDKYGVEHPMQSQELREKKKNTMMDNYGVEYPMQLQEIRDKVKSTVLEKYGVENPSQSQEIRNKINDTMMRKYGISHLSRVHLPKSTTDILDNVELFSETIKDKTLLEIKDILNVSTSTVISYVNKYDIRHLVKNISTSSFELKLENILQKYNIEYIANTRQIISPLELDFYIPKFNLAIEVGSNYFHSELSSGKSKYYHYNKWKCCHDQGITLLQYFDDDIMNKMDLIESKIKRLTGIKIPNIGARKLVIKQLTDFTVESEFLSMYHIQGPVTKRNVVLGAYYNDELCGISSWMITGNTAELVRYATNISFAYPGLFSKMLNTFKITTGFIGRLISFSDNKHSNGQLYHSTGFTLEHVSKPGYMYTKNYNNLESRLKYQKHKLSKIFNIDAEYASNYTEWELMKSMGYDRIWDAGQTKWVLDIW